MATDPRLLKKRHEATRLAALSARDTIEVGADLSAFAVELAEAARRAQH